jgi:glycosyltransferase involved in cell wall biosynthesis
MLERVVRAWKAAPVPFGVRKALAPLAARAVGAWRLRGGVLSRRPLADIAPGPLVLSGFLSGALGLATAARSTRTRLEALGLPVVSHDMDLLLGAPLYAPIALPTDGRKGGVWICQCNPPEFERLRMGMDRAALEQVYRIGVWAWELEVLPQAWVKAVPNFHEIWAPSTFVAQAIERALGPEPRPQVRVLPIPINGVAAPVFGRERFGIPPDAFAVLTMFDMRSTRARKNPDGAFEAYARAFPEPSAARILICKVLHHDSAVDEFEAFKRKVAARPDVVLMTEVLTGQEVGDLIANIDVMISLHRSEGYGLALAEAMHRGRVVVATGWSGNVDFMDEESAILIPYTLAPVNDPQKQYNEVAFWADPDIETAAQALRRLEASPDLRARIGAAARARIVDHEARFESEIVESAWLSKVVGRREF